MTTTVLMCAENVSTEIRALLALSAASLDAVVVIDESACAATYLERIEPPKRLPTMPARLQHAWYRQFEKRPRR